MGTPSLLVRFRFPLALAAAFVLCSCTRSYLFEDMRAEYSPPEIPAVFASGKRGWVASGFLTGNNQDPIRFRREDSIYWDSRDTAGRFYREQSTTGPSHIPATLVGTYRIERSPIQAGGSVAYQFRHWFAGIALSQGPLAGLGQFGAYSGWSQPIGRWVPLFAGGIYANPVKTTGKNWHELPPNIIGENGVPEGYFPDSATGHVVDYSLPLRTGVLYRAGRNFAPYFTLAVGDISIWPAEDEDTGRYGVWNTDLALGARYAPVADLAFGLELALTSVDGPNFYSGDAAKVMLTVERAWR